MKNKFWLLIVLFILFSLTIFVCGGATGYNIEKSKNTRIVHVNLDLDEEEIDILPARYSFLKSQLSDYICNMSAELGIDSDLVVAILMVENPEFNPEATHRNENGTTDLGLFQLNDKYCYTTFCNAYWDMTVEFNPYNWKHNAFIAMHHIEYLQKKLKIQDDVIMAYNCGSGSVLSNQIPQSTHIYLSRVKNNLTLLKNL